MRSRILLPVAGALLGLSFNVLAVAAPTVPSVLGSSSGTVTTIDSSCNDPADNGTSVFTLTVNILHQDAGGSISGNGTTDDGDSFTFSGSANVSGSITYISVSFSGSNVDGTTFGGGFSADLLSGAWVIDTLSGSSSDGCNFSGSGKLLLASGGTVGAGSAGVVATTPTQTRLFVTAFTSVLSSHAISALHGTLGGARPTVNGFLLESPTGRAAGDGFQSLGVWGSLGRSEFKNDFTATAFDGSRVTLLGGADISPTEDMIAGVAIGYETADVTTTFNSGKQQTDGWTIAPYAAALLNDRWSMDASVGFSHVGTDQFRTTAPALGGARVTSDVTTKRLFASVNLNGTYTVGDWTFAPRAGWSLARSYDGSFVETNAKNGLALGTIGSRVTRLGQWRVGGEASYAVGDFEPYGGLTYEHDYSFTRVRTASATQPANDNDDVMVAAGLRYYGQDGLTSSIEWNKRLSRQDFSEHQLQFTLRYDF